MTRQFNTDGGVWYYAFKKPNWRAISQLEKVTRELKEQLKAEGRGENVKEGDKVEIPVDDILGIFHPFFRVGQEEHQLRAQSEEWWQNADFDFTEKVLEDFMIEFEEQVKAKNPTLQPSELKKTTG